MHIHRTFLETTARFPERPFLHIPRQAAAAYRDGPVDLSYAGAREQVEALRARYRDAGYGTGHRVALVLDNRAEFFLHFLALNSIGAGIVPVNSAFTTDEMRYVIDHSDAVLVVSLPEHQESAVHAASYCSPAVPVSVVDGTGELPPAPPQAPPGETGPKMEAALLYTSGTTGKPKGCILSNEYFLCMGEWYRNLGGYGALRDGVERLITPLPLVHMNALACSSMGMIRTGGCLIQLDRFHASTWWETVRESGATCLHYLGVMPAILLNAPESPDDDFSGRIRFGLGAGVDPRHQERFERRFGFPLVEGWAMTESGTEVCIMANRDPRHPGQRCMGKPTGPVEYRLVDEQGNDVPEGEPGELLIRVRGPDPRKGFFSGYYKDGAATEEAWKGGYFHTGDIVRVGPDGSFFFVDRRKNIIRRSGENIAAVEVEGILFRHEAIANCAVTPVPDEIRGEEVAACIILNEGWAASEETARAITGFCSEHLAYYKVPGYLLFREALPMTPSQKIQRGEIKKLAAAAVERGEAVDLRELKRRRKT